MNLASATAAFDSALSNKSAYPLDGYTFLCFAGAERERGGDIILCDDWICVSEHEDRYTIAGKTSAHGIWCCRVSK